MKQRRQEISHRGAPVFFSAVEPGASSKTFLEARARMNLTHHRSAGGVRPPGWRGEEMCHLSGKPIRIEDGVYIVTSVLRLFPVVMVSKAAADKIGLEATVVMLEATYNEAMKYKHWFF